MEKHHPHACFIFGWCLREAVPAKQALQELQDAGLSEVPDLSQLSKVVPWSIDGWMDGWMDR